MRITKDMLIGQILREYPETAGILQSFGMGCVYCPSAQGESIEQAAMVHGLNLDALIEALNK